MAGKSIQSTCKLPVPGKGESGNSSDIDQILHLPYTINHANVPGTHEEANRNIMEKFSNFYLDEAYTVPENNIRHLSGMNGHDTVGQWDSYINENNDDFEASFPIPPDK